MSVRKIVRLPEDVPMETLTGLLETIDADKIDDHHFGVTPLLWAVRTRRPEVIQAILEKGSNPVRVFRSLPNNEPIESIRGVLDTIPIENINNQYYRMTPLIAAIRMRRPEVVQAVLDRGADPNFENRMPGDEVHLPLVECVSFNSSIEEVNMLLERGANPNAVANQVGDSILLYSIQNGDDLIARRLIESGADINFMDEYGNNILDNTIRRIAFYQRRGLADMQAAMEELRNFLIERGAVVGNPQQRNAARARLLQGFPAIGPAAAPPAGHGIAFEVHNAFYKINKQRFIAFMEREMPMVQERFNAAPTNPAFGNYVVESLENLQVSLPNNSNNDRNRKQLALTDLNAFSQRLKQVNYDDETRKIIFYTLEFVTRQSAEFMNVYIKNFTSDCATAYGQGGISCTKGIIERIVTSLTPASLLHVGEPIYDELVTIINPKLLSQIFKEVGSECSELPDVTKEQFRACVHERIRARYEMQGTPYNANVVQSVNTELNTFIPALGIFDGGAQKRKQKQRTRRLRRMRRTRKSVRRK